MQVILDSSFARPGSAPICGGKKGEFRDWTKELSAFLFFLGRAVLASAEDALPFVVLVFFAAAVFPFTRFEILSSSLLLVEDVPKSAEETS